MTARRSNSLSVSLPETAVAPEPALQVTSLVKQYRRSHTSVVNAVDNISLSVAPGEVVVLLGPSGCGKTTLLRSVAGLEHPDGGEITIHGRTVFSGHRRVDVPPERRHLGMMFQSYALWPHMTAFKNVAYPLTCERMRRSDIPAKVEDALDFVGIPELSDQYPGQMSGGQQQRVALARAIVSGRDLILFDEPLSNVDAKVREEVRFELSQMQRRLGFAAIYVTHDQEEGLSLADRLAVLNEGKLVQFDTPRAVYANPSTRYVANFVGSANELEGRVRAVDAGGRIVVETPLGGVVGFSSAPKPPSVGEGVVVIVRPHRVQLSVNEPDAEQRWRARVVSSMFVGHRMEYLVRIGDVAWRVWADEDPAGETPEHVWAAAAADDIRVLAD
jgi:iron(III) transport system ATP-binding protein